MRIQARMTSLEKFKSHICFDQTLLSEKQCKNLYTSVVISSDWNDVFEGIHQAPLPRRLKDKVGVFMKEDTRYGDEHLKKINEIISEMNFEDMDIRSCKEKMSSKSEKLQVFINNLETMCSQSIEKLTGEDVSKMYLSLVVGGTDLFEKSSPKLRYKERKAIAKHYKTHQIEHDPNAISTILSFVKHN